MIKIVFFTTYNAVWGFFACCLCLHRRVHELEEQVKDAEAKADQSLEDETKRHREAYSKMERDSNLEIDQLCNK